MALSSQVTRPFLATGTFRAEQAPLPRLSLREQVGTGSAGAPPSGVRSMLFRLSGGLRLSEEPEKPQLRQGRQPLSPSSCHAA